MGKARLEGRATRPEPKRVAELERRIMEHETEKRPVETDITAAFSLYEGWESTAG